MNAATVFRHLDDGAGGFVRDSGDRHWTHCASMSDLSADHVTYPVGYDSDCSWCYLGAAHSEAAHLAYVDPFAARVDAALSDLRYGSVPTVEQVAAQAVADTRSACEGVDF